MDNKISIDEKFNCIDCGKEVSTKHTKRCKHCSQLGILNSAIKGKRDFNGKNNPAFKDGRTLQKYHCIKCNKGIKWQTFLNGSKMCQTCENKELYKNPINHPSYIDGRSLNNKCIDCGKEIDYRRTRCFYCENKRRLKNKIGVFKNNYSSKPEKIILKILNKLYPNQYNYVQNNKILIDRYFPDFVDIKSKKIIEVFGDYWHNRIEVIKRDRKKLNMYKKLGYNYLIIWESESKNLANLIIKIKRFHNGRKN